MPRGGGRRTHYHKRWANDSGRARPACLVEAPVSRLGNNADSGWDFYFQLHRKLGIPLRITLPKAPYFFFFLFCVRWFAALVHIMRCALPRRIMLGPFSWRISPGLNAPHPAGLDALLPTQLARTARARGKLRSWLRGRAPPAALPPASPPPPPHRHLFLQTLQWTAREGALQRPRAGIRIMRWTSP